MHRLLVPAKAPAELETHRALRTREGLLARVDPLVTPQMANRGERCPATVATISSHARMNERVRVEQTRMPKLSTAVGANVGRLGRMRPLVVLKPAGLGEALVAARHRTSVWPLTGVDTVVDDQHGGVSEAPAASAAHVVVPIIPPLSGIVVGRDFELRLVVMVYGLPVKLQTGDGTKRLVAGIACMAIDQQLRATATTRPGS